MKLIIQIFKMLGRKLKKIFPFLAFAMITEGNNNRYPRGLGNPKKPEYKKSPKELLALKRERREQFLLRRGLKKYEYPGGYVIALNQKNADRKIKNALNKLSWINQ